jgi:hypothetical protein
VLLFATELGRIPAEQTFIAGAAWREVVMPVAAFGNGIDGANLQGILFSAGAGATSFRLQIDNVGFK